MKKTLLLLSAIGIACMSCGQSKQFDTCSDMASDFSYKSYDDLEKEFGEPSKKEESNSEYYVKWDGVGVNGKDVELIFEQGINVSYTYPSTFKGVYNCN